jgi:4-hydroxy-3-polyprenylbenzoate decarboxylase
MKTRIVVGICGASGALYGVRLLEKLQLKADVESHLVVSRAGEKTVHHETGILLKDLRAKADQSYGIDEVGAAIASGSFPTHGMVVAPCSVHTMSAIAYGLASNLLVRAADVALKERRKLILMVRESPLHLGHLRTMAAVTEMGAIVAPPMPDFYNRPATLDDVVEQGVGRILDLLGLPEASTKRWEGV